MKKRGAFVINELAGWILLIIGIAIGFVLLSLLFDRGQGAVAFLKDVIGFG